MAVYGVSPYALPRDIALGCMMNINAAQSWKTMPLVMGIGAALGNAQAISALRSGFDTSNRVGKAHSQSLIEELKLRGNR